MKAGELPNFLQALSPRGLRLKMLENNIKDKVTYVYSTPQFANGKWWVWFSAMPTDLIENQESNNEVYK